MIGAAGDGARHAADRIDRMALEIEMRARAATADAAAIMWRGPRRDRFVEEVATVIGGDSHSSARSLRELAAALRALAAEAEERAARLRRLEEAVRAGLADLARELSRAVHALHSELDLAARLAGAVGLDGIQAKIREAERAVLRVRSVTATLPPHDDPAWESVAAAWAAGRLV